jgi:hypothetical protein
VDVEVACKAIHKCTTKSFGMKLNALRKAFSDHGFTRGEDGEVTLRTAGPTSYLTPDGCRVQMHYPTEYNVTGEKKTKQTIVPEKVTVTSGLLKLRLTSPTFKVRNEEDPAMHARKGFVNFIHSVDALVARMIVVNMLRQGVEHIASIHDCFRVSIHDQAKLVIAIKETYQTLFGGRQEVVTKDLTEGNDFLKLYFDGANKALLEGEKETDLPIFFSDSGRRNSYMVGDATLAFLIDQLGITYYMS